MSASASSARLSFEPMLLDHVALVGTMERRNYEFSWSDAIFRDCLKSGYVCELVRLDNDIIGYAVLQTGAEEAHILNLCIDAPWQRQGFARLLLEHLIKVAMARRVRTVFLEVRPSNPRAVALYQQSGFNEIGIRKNYYEARNGREDAMVMARSLFGGA
ncbi:MAG: ribosomal protein S18-alanine N-acetyltransferase [Granulosicoccus sp.]|nr:ribosomal protein S18-alanine N-acetyltransferase [Granulosicoccus sp.]